MHYFLSNISIKVILFCSKINNLYEILSEFQSSVIQLGMNHRLKHTSSSFPTIVRISMHYFLSNIFIKVILFCSKINNLYEILSEFQSSVIQLGMNHRLKHTSSSSPSMLRIGMHYFLSNVSIKVILFCSRINNSYGILSEFQSSSLHTIPTFDIFNQNIFH